jgi:hypothetical protein
MNKIVDEWADDVKSSVRDVSISGKMFSFLKYIRVHVMILL